MTAYYNEFDPYAAQWLRNLIDAGFIAYGDVDERSITEVTPNDLKGYTQCHFFAGIGIWSLALRSARWPDSQPVWTGSCPCQPFSAAGRKEGLKDERHLWPVWYELIKKCKPCIIFGEQVSSKDAMPWVDNVQDNLEDSGYAFGALDICAAGVGAPHIRQRLFWVADSSNFGREGLQKPRCNNQGEQEKGMPSILKITRLCNTSNVQLANSDGFGLQRECVQGQKRTSQYSEAGRMADSECKQHEGILPNFREKLSKDYIWEAGQLTGCGAVVEAGAHPTNGLWRAADWLYCADGKWRPVRSGSFPLVNGDTNRVGRLRAYGNAINAEVAKEFIKSYIETKKEQST